MPASGIIANLEKKTGTRWTHIQSQKTNTDGRAAFVLRSGKGDFRIVFSVARYFRAQNRESFYFEIPVQFRISKHHEKLHIPLLLSPFSYSTYRGS